MTKQALSEGETDSIKGGWRTVLSVHPAADLFPMMEPDELRALAEDIKKHGIRTPITCCQLPDDPRRVVLDGRNRLAAAEMAGLDVRRVVFTLHSGDPYAFVVSSNLLRRHLTAEQRRELIAKLLKATPEKSNRQIAETMKVDHKTVGVVRGELQATGEIPQLTRTVGRDGKLRPAVTELHEVVSPAEKTAAKAERREQWEAELGSRQRAMPTRAYGVIYADPPWRLEPYSRETGMFLWGTVPMLPQALQAMTTWGFTYKSHFCWVKDRIGTGYWTRNQHELLLIGRRGNIPAPAPGEQFPSIVEAPVGKHSAKPARFREMIEATFPTLPRIELFARGEAHPGWDAWGNEVVPSLAVVNG